MSRAQQQASQERTRATPTVAQEVSGDPGSNQAMIEEMGSSGAAEQQGGGILDQLEGGQSGLGEPISMDPAILRERFFALQEQVESLRQRRLGVLGRIDAELQSRRRIDADAQRLLAALEEEGSEAITSAVGAILTTALGASSFKSLSPRASQLMSGFGALAGFGLPIGGILADILIEDSSASLSVAETGVVGASLLSVPAGAALDVIDSKLASGTNKPGAGFLIGCGIALIDLELQTFQFFHAKQDFDQAISLLQGISQNVRGLLQQNDAIEAEILQCGEEMLGLAEQINLAEGAL